MRPPSALATAPRPSTTRVPLGTSTARGPSPVPSNSVSLGTEPDDASVRLPWPEHDATVAVEEPNTWHGWLHVIGFVSIALASLVAPLVTALALRGNPRWRGFSAFSVAVVVVEAILFFPLDFLGDPAFVGYMVVLFGWVAALGLRLNMLGPPREA